MPTVVADKNKFKQVLINLIGNAMKFTKEGGISISLKNEGKFVKILVSDTGVGIPEKNQKLLFRKFQQAESNIFTRDATRGTGLGLYISKLLIEGMGGMLNIERSVVGKGTSFFIILPFATKESIDAAQREVAKIQVDFNNGPSYNTNKATTRASKMQSVVEPAVKASATKSVTATESKKPTQNLQNEKKSTGRTTTKSSVDTSKKKIIK